MFLKLVGKPAVVAVAEGYIASTCPFDGLVAGIAGTVVFREEGQFHSFVFSREAFKNLYCLLVCRMVVGDEQFEIADTRSFDSMYSDMEKEGMQPVTNDYLYVG